MQCIKRCSKLIPNKYVCSVLEKYYFLDLILERTTLENNFGQVICDDIDKIHRFKILSIYYLPIQTTNTYRVRILNYYRWPIQRDGKVI